MSVRPQRADYRLFAASPQVRIKGRVPGPLPESLPERVSSFPAVAAVLYFETGSHSIDGTELVIFTQEVE